MEKKSKFDFYERRDTLFAEKKINKMVAEYATLFYEAYKNALAEKGETIDAYLPVFELYLNMLVIQMEVPFEFEPYHLRVKEPLDYYHFGLDFFRPLIDWGKSELKGEENLETLYKQWKNGENIVFFANHQVEPDPQAISLFLEKKYPDLAEELICVAGERVLYDHLAAPFSMGCNLLCIYSKKHIDTPPEKKQEKQHHNKRTMAKMSELLAEGGKCIYVAPSGGRDRKDTNGNLTVAPFDAQSIEMFYLMAKRAKTKTHFYPLALATYDLMPPPQKVGGALGEKREPHYTPIHMKVGDEIEMEKIPNLPKQDKRLSRKVRGQYIHDTVCRDYNTLV